MIATLKKVSKQVKPAQFLYSISILKALFIRDIFVHNAQIIRRIVDAIVWSVTITIVAQYLLPSFGMNNSYGSFLVVANVGLWGLFEINTQLAEFLVEIEEGRSVSYFLTLPISTNFIFIKYALGYAYRSWIVSLMVLPFGMLIIPNLNHFSFSFFAIFKFLFLHALANIFYGFFCLYTAALSPNASYITTIRSRFIFPLWNFGCTNFSWNMLYKVSPVGAYISLLNPMTYISEGLRSTLLPEFDSLPYWICVCSVLLFILLFGYLSITRLKKRLDCL